MRTSRFPGLALLCVVIVCCHLRLSHPWGTHSHVTQKAKNDRKLWNTEKPLLSLSDVLMEHLTN